MEEFQPVMTIIFYQPFITVHFRVFKFKSTYVRLPLQKFND